MFKIIPEKILYDKDLPDKAKFIMAEIISFSVNSLDCFTLNETWAERYDIGKEQISRYVSLLVKKGYVIRKLLYKPNTKQISRRILIAHSSIMSDMNDYKKGIENAVLENEEREKMESYNGNGIDIEAFRKLFDK